MNDYDIIFIILRLWYFVVKMYVLFDIVFVIFNHYYFEGHKEDYLIVVNSLKIKSLLTYSTRNRLIQLSTYYQELIDTTVYVLSRTDWYNCLRIIKNWLIQLSTYYQELIDTTVYVLSRTDWYNCLRIIKNWLIQLSTYYQVFLHQLDNMIK
jgi:uncharacterized protein YlaN (UPF0358 family)